MRWIGTWACAPQLTEPENGPPPPGLDGNVLRQVVFTSIAGQQLRLRLSNEFGDGPVTLRSMRLALSTGGGGIDIGSERAVNFAGAAGVTIPAGETAVSDPLPFALPALARIAVTIRFGAVPAGLTGHPGSRATSYLGPDAAPVPHWYYLTGLDVLTDDAAGAIVVLGDSLTDGRGSTTDGDDRWPDNLSRRLRADAVGANVAVLNLGLGGNAVLAGGNGPTTSARFRRDALGQSGARWLIVLAGVNDIGASPDGASLLSARLTAAYARFVGEARADGLRVYGVPILPFGGSDYAVADREVARQLVNAWIRTAGHFDAVIDLEAAVRDPGAPTRLAAGYDGGDHLHLNAAGYRRMAEAVDLALFAV